MQDMAKSLLYWYKEPSLKSVTKIKDSTALKHLDIISIVICLYVPIEAVQVMEIN